MSGDNDMKKTVHIIMASYNGEKYLEEQLDSLLGQTCQDISVEVCDDGSADRTCDIVKQYCSRDHRITLHKNEKNKGYVRNFLEGMQRSDADYIMLCDQDDIWDRDKVEVTLHAMQQAEKDGCDQPLMVFTDAVNFDSDTGKDLGRFHENSHLNTKRLDTAHLFMENKVIGCTVMVNHKVISYLTEIPQEIRVHDWWLALICSHFGRIIYLDRPTLRYRQHSGNMIGGSSFGSYVKDRLAGIRSQREALRLSYLQGQSFLAIYGDRMTPEQRETAEKFAGLDSAGWFMRRWNVMKYGFTKSGMMRNAGLFLLL